MKKVRTRYAPSPTGYFHIGGARSALFNYLYAKHYGGDFILRIEDTDLARNVSNGIQSQYDNLIWLGSIPDESIYNPNPKYIFYKQSEKFALYKDIANELLENNLAYRCFCSKEELELAGEQSLKNNQTPKYNRHCLYLTKEEIDQKIKDGLPYVIRLKISQNKEYAWNDLIRGKISIPSSALTDYAILKSNSVASYNFSNVIDDNDMEITHIIRGQEHISNTPYQLATIESLKKLPRYKNNAHNFAFVYGHLPIVINEAGKKLSKRDTNLKQFISDYKEMGFLPIAINNFLVLIGWTSPNNKEYFDSLDEMIKEFDGTRINKAPGVFDFKKMLSLNKHHLNQLSNEEYLKQIKPFIETDLGILKDKEDELALLFRKDIKYFGEINELIKALLEDKSDDLTIENKTIIDNAIEKDLDKIALSSLEKIENWDDSSLSSWLKDLANTTNLKGKNLYLPLRIWLFHKEHGPEFVKLLLLFGKQYCIKQLEDIKK